jgi:hypothetical protein
VRRCPPGSGANLQQRERFALSKEKEFIGVICVVAAQALMIQRGGASLSDADVKTLPRDDGNINPQLQLLRQLTSTMYFSIRLFF